MIINTNIANQKTQSSPTRRIIKVDEDSTDLSFPFEAQDWDPSHCRYVTLGAVVQCFFPGTDQMIDFERSIAQAALNNAMLRQGGDALLSRKLGMTFADLVVGGSRWPVADTYTVEFRFLDNRGRGRKALLQVKQAIMLGVGNIIEELPIALVDWTSRDRYHWVDQVVLRVTPMTVSISRPLKPSSLLAIRARRRRALELIGMEAHEQIGTRSVIESQRGSRKLTDATFCPTAGLIE